MRSSSIAPPGRQPRQIGHYKVLHLLARGGMGDVYLARDTRLGRVVAVKRASLDLAERPEVRKQFLLEAQATAQLAHPNVVTIYDVGDDGGVPWAAYEYVEGRTLARRLRDGVPSRPEAMRIALDVAAALTAAHDEKLIHRDLKPANIMIGRDGRTRVLDFGIARFFRRSERADEGPTDTTNVEAFLGTPGYMSPEQWRHEDHIATDVWAFGLILCELFTGEPALSGRSHVEILRMMMTDEPLPLPEGVQRLSRPLQELIRECVLFDPDARPPMPRVRAALEAITQRPQREAPAPRPGEALAPLGADDADQLLGRERELAALDEALALRELCFVVGEPGAGKTSLVEAGLLPARRSRGQRVVRCVLRDRPLHDLAQALVAEARGSSEVTSVERRPSFEADLDAPFGELPAEDTVVDAIHGAPTRARHLGLLLDADDLAGHLRREPGVLALALETLAATWSVDGKRREQTDDPRREVLLWIDGLEQVVGREDARTLLEALELATLGRDEGWQVVAAVRADAFGALPLSPEGRRRAGLVQVELLGPETLRAILLQSVASWGYQVDDADAVDTLVAPLVEDPFGLLMLRALLAELWLRRDTTRHTVGTGQAARDDLARTAFARHADGVFDGLAPEQREEARAWLIEIALPGGRGALDLTDPTAHQAEILDALVSGRLLRPAGAEQRWVLAHPALPRLWPRLARWLAEADADADAALELEDEARRWVERGRHDGGLLEGSALERAVQLGERRALAPDALQFVLRSEEEARRQASRRRWRRRGVVLGAVLAAAASWTVSLLLSERAEEARAAQRLAEESRAALLAQSSILELEAGHVRSARARARAALERHDTIPGRLAFERTQREPVRWHTHWNMVGYEVALDATRERAFVALQSGEVAVLDLTLGIERRVRAQADQTTALALDGDRLITGAYDGTLSIFDADALAEGPRVRRSLPGAILRVVGLSDGRVAAATRNHGVLLIDPRGEREDVALAPDDANVFALSATTNGRWLGLAGGTGVLRVVDLQTDRVVSEVSLEGHGTMQVMATDGARFVLGSSGGAILSVDWARRTVEVHELLGGRIRALALRGERVLAGDMNGDVAWLDLGTGATRSVGSLEGAIYSLGTEGDEALLSHRAGATLIDWTRRATERSRPLPPVYGLAFDPEGERVIAAQGGSLLFRARDDGRLLRRAEPLELAQELRSLAYGPGGERIAAWAPAWGLIVADAQNGTRRGLFPTPVHGARVPVLWTSPSRVLYAARDGRVEELDVERLRPVRAARAATPGHVISLAHVDGRIFLGRQDGRLLELIEGDEGDEEGAPWELVERARFDDSVQAITSHPLGGLTLLLMGGEVGRYDLQDRAWRPFGDAETRALAADLCADGAYLVAAGTDGALHRWNLRDGAYARLPLSGQELNDVRCRGRTVAVGGDDGFVHLLDAVSLEPLWGSEANDPGSAPVLRDEVDGRACEVFADRRVVGPGIEGRLAGSPRAVLRKDETCVTANASGEVRVWRPGGGSTRLAEGASAIARSPVGFWYADATGLHELTLGGEARGAVPLRDRVTTLVPQEGGLLLGTADGDVAQLALPEGRELARMSMGRASPVRALEPGPGGAMMVGLESGLVRVVHLGAQAQIETHHLHGAIRDMRSEGTALVARSTLGDEWRVDLGFLVEPYCALMRRVWEREPLTLAEDETVVAAPAPAGHPCAGGGR